MSDKSSTQQPKKFFDFGILQPYIAPTLKVVVVVALLYSILQDKVIDQTEVGQLTEALNHL